MAIDSTEINPRPMPDADRFALVSKALADPRRFALLERIAAQPEVGCRELLQGCPLTQATVSHHLKGLMGAGLVAVRREGKHAFFRAIPGGLDDYLDELRRRLSGSVTGGSPSP